MATNILNKLLLGLDRIVSNAAASSGLREDFIRFGIVGTFGFCWDTATVYAVRPFAGLYVAGTAGFLVAATANWGLNRIWTFRHQEHESAGRQLPKFVIANGAGFVINRGLFFILISLINVCREQPVLAIIAGSAAGLGLNYLLSKKFVFR